jgi:hypothetical protein
MVYASTFWLNSFPPIDGVSKTLSPRAIVAGLQIDYAKHCKLEFGTYVQTHEEHDNSMASRTTGAIALWPTGNEQGGYYFLSLTTGRRLNRNRWTALPMPGDAIERVHTLARRSGAARGLTFADRLGVPLVDPDDDDDDDESYNPDDDDPADEDIPADDESVLEYDVDDVPTAGVNVETVDEDDGDEEHNNTEIEQIPENEERQATANEEDNIENQVQEETPDIEEAPAKESMDAKYGERSGAHNLRARRPRNYSHLHATLEGTVMTQHSMKKGIEIFGEAGIDAVLAELKQLHDRKVLEPKKATAMTREDKRAALQYLMFLKKKRCGRIKGRGCANGSTQRAYTPKEDASSPTVAIESIMISCVIDAIEKRDVATADIPGAFMQADMEDIVHMKMEGRMAELLVKLDPKLYRKYATVEKGKTVLYVELKKALYGTLKAALLFWKMLTAQLKEWGFEVNPYDWCVANKMIDGKQCTILWHVDDLKISHVDADVVTDILEKMKGAFGKEAPLTVTRGKVHEYLGMTLDFSSPDQAKILMTEYIQGILDEMPPEFDGEAATAAANHLFEVNTKDPTMLDDKKAEMFHHNVAKMLFLCKRARPDIQTAVAFLCTRVKGPDTDN